MCMELYACVRACVWVNLICHHHNDNIGIDYENKKLHLKRLLTQLVALSVSLISLQSDE